MKRLIFAAGLLVSTVSASLHAQSMNLRASIPFEFRIGSTVFPSGEYSIRNSSGILSVTSAAGNHQGGFFMTVGEDRPHSSTAKDALLFNRYGDAYYLSMVWTRESETARYLTKTPRETELASHTGTTGTFSVALRTQ